MTVPAELIRNSSTLVAVKRPIPVTVRFAHADGVCQTLEGPVRYLAGDAILTGSVGESWPVERAKFDARYQPAPGTNLVAGTDGDYIKLPLPVRALRLDMPLDVAITGGVLHGEAGDWLVEFTQDDCAIIADAIFRQTYRIVS